MSRSFGYIIDLDERGEFAAHVLDLDTDEIVMTIASEDDGSIALCDDGYMRHNRDMNGLFDYLVTVMGIAHAGDDLDLMFR